MGKHEFVSSFLRIVSNCQTFLLENIAKKHYVTAGTHQNFTIVSFSRFSILSSLSNYLLLQNRTGVYVTFLRAAVNTNRPHNEAIFANLFRLISWNPKEIFYVKSQRIFSDNDRQLCGSFWPRILSVNLVGLSAIWRKCWVFDFNMQNRRYEFKRQIFH